MNGLRGIIGSEDGNRALVESNFVDACGSCLSLQLAIARLLLTENPDWQKPLYRAWTGQDQVRTNAMMALLRLNPGLNPGTEEWIDLIIAALPDKCGYVGGFGVEILRRQNTPRALRAALDYLCAHRWDNTLKKGVRTF